MKTRAERLTELLAPLAPLSLELVDDSHKHAGHAAMKGLDAAETHFRLHIVSEAFEGKSRIERHRMVQKLVQPEMETGLHALQIKALTAQEQ